MTTKKIVTLFAVLLLAALQVTAPVWAEDEAFSHDTVTIEGSHHIDGNESLHSGRHTFVLTATDGAPMPEGSENGVKRVTINSNEDFSFGGMSFTQPGTYEYTVSRDIVQAENLIQDDTVYKCKVAAFSDGTTVVVFEKIGTEGKPNKIEYTDTYKETPPEKDKEKPKDEPEKEHSKTVKTGDTSAILYAGAAFAAAAAILLYILKRARNKD